MKKTIGLAVILLAINSTTFAQVKENENKENIKIPDGGNFCIP